ncbi:hypothetical protein OH77DRAFT_1490038 [Trametes cingulata]|nr:hypothetical protein OH77DRAFT_1490038 [Trametes cingulata]
MRRAQGRRDRSASSRAIDVDLAQLLDPEYLTSPSGPSVQREAPPTDEGGVTANTSSRKRALEDVKDATTAPKQPRTDPAPGEAEPVIAALAGRVRCPEFHYCDGNIFVVVENVEFRLHLSRLQQHCEFFRTHWGLDDEPCADGAERKLDVGAAVQDRRLPVAAGPGQPVGDPSLLRAVNEPSGQGALVEAAGVINAAHAAGVVGGGAIPEQTLDGLTVPDFLEFIRALETPLMYAMTPPSQAAALALLRVATPLGCPAVAEFARRRLRQLWPDTLPPDPIETIGYPAALEVISAARAFGLPELLKRAFYEVLRSAAFWERVEAARHELALALADADLLMLARARYAFQQLWCERVLVPPPHPCATGRCLEQAAAKREVAWYGYVVKSGYLQRGHEDPLLYIDGLRRNVTKSLGKAWCTACLEASMASWAAAKQEWWKKIDELFGLRHLPRV